MTADLRGVAYPLAALHLREQWALDALQAELAMAVQRVMSSSSACERYRERLRTAAAASTPAARMSIDPALAQARLRHLGSLQRHLVVMRAEQVHHEQAQHRARAAVERQHMKLEAMARHRAAFLRHAAVERLRRDTAEVDREWLARSPWRRGFTLVVDAT